MVESVAIPKRSNVSRQRVIFTRRLAIPILVLVLVALVIAMSPSVKVIPTRSSSSVQKPVVPDWRSCNRNAECCARLLSPNRRPHRVTTATVRLGDGTSMSWPMATHANHDIVSGEIHRRGGWDLKKTLEVLNTLRNAGKQPTLFDVGANIGWFTMAMANAGYSVIAVEPFAENLALLRHSLCLAERAVADRVKIFNYALGNRDGMRCELWQLPLVNRGDTFLVCDGVSNKKSSESLRKEGYKKLGEAHVRRLDVLLATKEIVFQNPRSIVMKIDVEGFEPMAMEGAKEFLANYRPRVIFSEYGEGMIRRSAETMGATAEEAKKSPKKFLDYMAKAGYSNDVLVGTDQIQEANFIRKT